MAFVLSGAASLGAVQVGMLRALYERGITPDLVVGTSAGALTGLLGFLGSRDHLVPDSGLRRLRRGARRRAGQRSDPSRSTTGAVGMHRHRSAA